MTNETIQNEIAAKIAAQNDEIRQDAYNYIMTKGITSLDSPSTVIEIVAKVRTYSSFTEDSDPYGEHDFGSFTVAGEKVFWKIDYYTQDLSGWCDPLDPDCRRVITVMLAEEY